MKPSEREAAQLARYAGAGYPIAPDEWDAFPEVARRELRRRALGTASERARAEALLGWLRAEFPPGWIHPKGEP